MATSSLNRCQKIYQKVVKIMTNRKKLKIYKKRVKSMSSKKSW